MDQLESPMALWSWGSGTPLHTLEEMGSCPSLPSQSEAVSGNAYNLNTQGASVGAAEPHTLPVSYAHSSLWSVPRALSASLCTHVVCTSCLSLETWQEQAVPSWARWPLPVNLVHGKLR